MSHGLGRRHAPDLRDADYPVRALVPEPSFRTHRYWNDAGWWGDQGDRPHCVGFSWAHWLEDGPMTQHGSAPLIAPGWLYAEAQKVDEWEGESYDGTSVRAGAKVLQSHGLVSEYRWALSLEEVVDAIAERGPVVVGTNWYTSMFEPNGDGWISRLSGSIEGGHAYVLNGVNRIARVFRIKNSWGRGWGANGRAWIPFDLFAQLLEENGEACLAVEVRRGRH